MTQQEFTERYKYDATLDLLSENGNSRVYRAYDNEDHEYVALKMQAVNPMQPELRLRKEVEKVLQLQHRNIATYKACYTFTTFSGDMDVAVMKYYENGNLDQLMRSGKLNIQSCYSILGQILEGIAFLHSHNIVHRNLKPQNIFIVEHDGEYTPLIADSGISKHNYSSTSNAYAYTSPEQIQKGIISKNSDLWSFGIIAFQMFTGKHPFNSGIITEGVLPQEINHIPEPWQTIIRRCLIINTSQRIASAEEALNIINSGDNSGDNVCDNSCDNSNEHVATNDTAIVTGSVDSNKTQENKPFNKLYRRYAIGAIASIVTLFISLFFTHVAPAIYSTDFGEVLYLIYISAAIIGFIALVFTVISLRGFARVQKSPSSTHAAHVLSWGAIIGAIANAMSYVSTWNRWDNDSNFAVIWILFTTLVFVGAIVVSQVGINKLMRDSVQYTRVRSGLSLIRVFVYIAAGISLLQFLFKCVNATDYDEDFLVVIAVLEFFKLMLLVLPIIGAVKIIGHREEITEDEYKEICQRNEEQRSEHKSLKALLYTFGSIFTLYSFQQLYFILSSAISRIKWDYEIPNFNFEDYEIWDKIFYRVIHSDFGMYALFGIVTLALSLWLLTRPKVRDNKLTMISLITMAASSLIMPILFFFAFSFEILDIDIDGFIEDVFDVVIITGRLSLLLYPCILLYVYGSSLKKYFKIILSIVMIPVIIGLLYEWLYETSWSVDAIDWIRDLSGKEFMDTFWTVYQLCYALMTATLLIAAAFTAPCKSKGWIKWIVVGIASLFVVFFTYSYFKIENIEKEAKAWVEQNTYSIGDYYNKNGVKGIVVEVNYNRQATKLISLTESNQQWDNSMYWSEYWECYRGGSYVGASDSWSGEYNTRYIANRYDSDKFSAFNWCTEQGSGWYLPARYELTELEYYISEINATLSKKGYPTLVGEYWSSTEDDSQDAYCVNINSGESYYTSKNNKHYVRAMYKIYHNEDGVHSIDIAESELVEAVEAETYYYEDEDEYYYEDEDEYYYEDEEEYYYEDEEEYYDEYEVTF